MTLENGLASIGIDPDHAVLTTSGSAAFLSTLLAINCGPGDEVVLPVSICQTMVNTVLLTGALPILADCDEDLGIDAPAVDAALTEQTRAVVAHHPFGLARSLVCLRDVLRARHSDALLIEDCAQAAGAHVGNAAVGGEGDVALYSFGATKPVAAGVGGLASAPDAGLAALIRRSAETGTPGWPDDKALGWGCSLPIADRSVVAAALATFPDRQRRRVEAAEDMIARWKDENGRAIHEQYAGARPYRHVFHRVIVDVGDCCDEVRQHLAPDMQTAVPRPPYAMTFLARRYRAAGRDDLCDDRGERFPRWLRAAERYRFIRTLA